MTTTIGRGRRATPAPEQLLTWVGPAASMDPDALRTALRLQAGGCRHYGSPFYADMLDAGLAELGRGGPLERLVADWEGDPLRGFLPLRVLGAVHERVLAGAAPELARFYPSVGGQVRMPEAWHAFRDVLETQRDVLRASIERWPQTNEVRRCASLLGGFLWIARRLRQPLHLREIGASAGLNLLWDRYRYALGPHRWGRPDAPVRIEAEWEGPPAPFDAELEVASRAGCDLAPVRVEDAAQVRRLESFVWADQPERLTELRAAVAVARSASPRLDAASAADWLETELAAADRGDVFVLFHSAVWIYLDGDEQERIRQLLADRGSRAPLAWLRQEHREDDARVELRVELWPAGDEVVLAEGHPHGRRVRWQVPEGV